MEPTTTSTQTNTEYASYLYTSVNALGGITSCTGAESTLNTGAAPLDHTLVFVHRTRPNVHLDLTDNILPGTVI